MTGAIPRMLSLLAASLLALGAAPGPAVAAAPVAAPAWEVVWRQPTPGVIQGPMYDGGQVLTFTGASIQALDPTTGAVRWQYQAPPQQDASALLGCGCATGVLGGPSAATGAAGALLARGEWAELRALRPEDGSVRWATQLPDPLVAPPLLAATTIVAPWAGSNGYGLAGLDAASGSLRWTVTTPSRPSAVISGDLVIAAQADGTLLAYELASGQLRWSARPARWLEPLRPSQASATVLALRDGPRLLGLDPASGELRWTAALEGGPSVPWVQGEQVYVSTGAGAVAGLDARTGQPRWQVRLPAPPELDGLTLLGGMLVVTTTHGGVVVLDAASGEQRWSVEALGSTYAPPVQVGEAIAFATFDVARSEGELVVLAAASGEVVGRVALGGPVFYPLAVDDDTVYAVVETPGTQTTMALRPLQTDGEG